MKIVILFASPNKKGSTYLLTDSFMNGAREKGHEATMIDVAHANINPCFGCVKCGYEGPCVQKDDMETLRKKILESDMLVFASPLYYFGWSAQLKIVVDRFCAMNYSLSSKRMKSALIVAAWNDDSWTFDAIKSHYETLVRYLHFSDMGMILGGGCGSPSMTKNSHHILEAYELGKRL